MNTWKKILGLAGALVFATSGLARAGDSWTFPVLAIDGVRDSAALPFEPTEKPYTSLDSSEVTKKWKLCYLIAHTTNDIVKAYIYGTVEEAKRLKASLTIFDAGGYDKVDKQLAQFDDCVTLGADAILLMAVSPTAFSEKIKEARAKGIKVVDMNVGVNAPVDGRVVVTYVEVGKIIGKTLAALNPKGGAEVESVILPGPAGVAWSEDTATGVKKMLANSSVKVDKVIYGGPGRLDQVPLIEDALVTYPDLKYIIGMGTSIEAALNSLREQGRLDKLALYGSFITPDLIQAIKDDHVKGVVVENSIVVNKLSVDMAVRLLEGKAQIKDAIPAVTLVDKTNVDQVPANNFTPAGWQMQMKVD